MTETFKSNLHTHFLNSNIKKYVKIIVIIIYPYNNNNLSFIVETAFRQTFLSCFNFTLHIFLTYCCGKCLKRHGKSSSTSRITKIKASFHKSGEAAQKQRMITAITEAFKEHPY